jgi:hypothetical protein
VEVEEPAGGTKYDSEGAQRERHAVKAKSEIRDGEKDPRVGGVEDRCLEQVAWGNILISAERALNVTDEVDQLLPRQIAEVQAGKEGQGRRPSVSELDGQGPKRSEVDHGKEREEGEPKRDVHPVVGPLGTKPVVLIQVHISEPERNGTAEEGAQEGEEEQKLMRKAPARPITEEHGETEEHQDDPAESGQHDGHEGGEEGGEELQRNALIGSEIPIKPDANDPDQQRNENRAWGEVEVPTHIPDKVHNPDRIRHQQVVDRVPLQELGQHIDKHAQVEDREQASQRSGGGVRGEETGEPTSVADDPLETHRAARGHVGGSLNNGGEGP